MAMSGGDGRVDEITCTDEDSGGTELRGGAGTPSVKAKKNV